MEMYIPIGFIWIAGCIALTVSLAFLLVIATFVFLYFSETGIGVLDEDFENHPHDAQICPPAVSGDRGTDGRSKTRCNKI